MTLRLHVGDPSEVIEDLYQRIQRERMQDVPFLNAALRVEAIDFQPWHGQWLGAVVTPWTMLLALVPQDAASWESAHDNQRRFVTFPAGSFAFLGNVEPEIGEFQTCSLFAQMAQFSSQHLATATARASLLALLSPPAQVNPPKVHGDKAVATVKPPTRSVAPTLDASQAARRRFLFMR